MEQQKDSWSVSPCYTPKWEWRVFGGDELVVRTPRDLPWLMRLRARIFLGSRFERLT